MNKTQQFDKKIIFEYKPSLETMELGLLVMEEIGKLNVEMNNVLKKERRAARIFAFIESKYSSKIEGIYTTLFDVVNRGFETKQQHLIKPIVDELFNSKELINVNKLKSLEEIMNNNISKENRWSKEFGIYQIIDNKKIKIYQPPLDEIEVGNLLNEVIDKSSKDDNIIKMLHSHIMFEKVHPFSDANGRLGRLILQRSLARLMNFSSVLPLSQSIFSNQGEYYDSFDIHKEGDLNISLMKLLNIVLRMCKTTSNFLKELDVWAKKSFKYMKQASNKVSDELAEDLIFSLQTKVSWVVKTYGINRKTVDHIFERISGDLDFNRKIISKKVAYWNIELEGIIDTYYR